MGGIRNIKDLSKRYNKAKIYFHQDLDGVTTALAMKEYLKNNGIDVVDSEVIQYGDREFAVKKPSARGDVMPVLVDFAHGKPMFIIHTDHHDKQIGTEKGASKSFRQARSNVETISQVVSSKDIFPSDDIKMISTVDSADFAKLDIKPEELMNYIFKYDKENDLLKNKMAMALVTNKLLLAYKNKAKFLESLVMDSTPSIKNIYLNIVKMAKEDGYVSPEVMKVNLQNYIKSQSESDKVQYDEDFGIISQYGGGALFKPGSYDRYVPFKLYPNANFLVIVWPMGLLQASCNPFKKNRELKGVNLGEIAEEVLEVFKTRLKEKKITIDTIKYFAEKSKHFNEDSVGFNYNDMMAMFEDSDEGVIGLETPPKGSSEEYTTERWVEAIKKVMSKPYDSLSEREIKALKLLRVTGWDMIKSNSGGHKCITNISGLTYFGKDGKEFLKDFQEQFVKILKDRITKDKITENFVTKKSLLKEALEFKDIYRSLWDKMLNQVCMKYTNNSDKAQDFCQDGFMKVYKNLNKYDGKGSLEGWVRRVINNNILDSLRKSKNVAIDNTVDGFNLSTYEQPIEDDSKNEDDIQQIIKFIPKLTPAYRKTLELYYLSGLTHKEIAKKLGVSISSSKTNLMKAKSKIRGMIKKQNK